MRRAPVSIEGLKPMTFSLKAGIALVALSGAAAVAGSATAADLGGARGGSMKDGGYMAPMPEIVRGAAGPCYFRADVGYSFAQDPEMLSRFRSSP